MTDDTNVHIETFRARLEHLQGRLESLRARMGRITAATSAEFDRQMGDLRLEMEESRDEVSKLASTGKEAWKDLEAGFEAACQELKNAFENATTRFH